MFKKSLIALLVINMMLLLSGFSSTKPQENYYGRTAFIVDIDYNSDTVTVKDACGLIWSFPGTEDYAVGDVVSMVMYNDGDESIFDDEIISTRYSGYVVGDLR